MELFKGIEPARGKRPKNRKLNYELIAEAYEKGYTQKQIAEVLKCSRQGVACALKVIRKMETEK